MASDVWAAQPGYTGGPPVLFWDGKELIELRLVRSGVTTAAAAARSIGARYFFMRTGYDILEQVYTWSAYDAEEVFGAGPLVMNIKTFRTNDTAPLVMWAAAKGGM